MEFDQYFINKSGKYELTGEKIKLDCDYVISAFGSKNEQKPIAELVRNS